MRYYLNLKERTGQKSEPVTSFSAEPGDEESGVHDGDAEKEGRAADDGIGVRNFVTNQLSQSGAQGHAQQARKCHDDAKSIPEKKSYSRAVQEVVNII